MVDGAPGSAEAASDKRVRRSHTRSRAGCLACKKRHVRCDEKRPSCVKCLSAGRTCEYPAISLPLHERRGQGKASLPGEQQPWSTADSASSSSASSSVVLQQSPPTPSTSWQRGPSVDPFENAPLKMAFKSKQLLHYFHQVGDSLGVSHRDRSEDCLALAVRDRNALRNTILFAGLHYSWVAGGLREYDSTVLFHKGETMRMINHTVRQPGLPDAAACAKQIATLCWIECCLGSLPTAEAHLGGLIALLDLRDQLLIPKDRHRHGLVEELLDRYLIITYSFIHGMKTRLKEVPVHETAQAKENTESIEEQIRIWHEKKILAYQFHLKTLRMYPYFFSYPPKGRMTHAVDVLPIIRNLRSVAYIADQSRLQLQEGVYDSISEPLSRMAFHVVETHRKSLSPEPEEEPSGRDTPQRLMAPWSGVNSALALFMNSVAGISNGGEPIDGRLHRRVLFILKRDIDKTMAIIRLQEGLDRDLWFWKAFIGAMSLALSRGDVDDRHSLDALDALRLDYHDYVRAWSRVTNVSRWNEAKAALFRVAWMASPNEEIAERLWESIAGTRDSTTPSRGL